MVDVVIGKEFLDSLISEYGLFVAVLVIFNIVQWRRNCHLHDKLLEIATNTASLLSTLAERLNRLGDDDAGKD